MPQLGQVQVEKTDVLKGCGATFGDFKEQANGLGPAISFARKNVIAELKWLKEFGNENRLEGDTLWLKIVGKF